MRVVQLTIRSGADAGRTVPVEGSEFTIGRQADCDLVLTDLKVSRHHAAIRSLPDGRQVPAGRGWGPTLPLAVIDGPVAEQDATDRPHRWSGTPLGEERVPNPRGPALAQDILRQGTAQREDALLDARARAVGRVVGAGAVIGPVNTIEPQVGRARYPVLHAAQTGAEPPGDRALGTTVPHRGDHHPAALLDRGFLFTSLLPEGNVFPPS